MTAGHVTAHAVWNADLKNVVLTDAASFHARLRKVGFGNGEALTIRVEREADARTYAQLKYWHGYVLAPLVEYTGDHDWRLYLKAMFLPDGKTSLTELDYEEMLAFTEQSEAWARAECPMAYEQCGREYVA
jgi:hypothetical protein